MVDPPVGCSGSYWSAPDRYVGYYPCYSLPAPCMGEVPGWTQVSNSNAGLGTYCCSNCIVREIIWQRVCTPNWVCELPLNGYEIDGCGNKRANPACAYREAVLASCEWPSNVIAGQSIQLPITINQGSMTENYKLVFSGDFAGELSPFTVNAGTGQQQFTVGNLIFTTGGAKNVTASLVKA